MKTNKAFSFLCVVIALCSIVCTLLLVSNKVDEFIGYRKNNNVELSEPKNYQETIDKIMAEINAEKKARENQIKNEKLQKELEAERKKKIQDQLNPSGVGTAADRFKSWSDARRRLAESNETSTIPESSCE